MQRMPDTDTGFTLPTQEELGAWFGDNLPKFVKTAVEIEKDKLQQSLISKYAAGNRRFNPSIFTSDSSRKDIERIASIRGDIGKKKFLYAFLGEIFDHKKNNSAIDLSDEVLTQIIAELTKKVSELPLSDRSTPMSLKELTDFCQTHYLAKAAAGSSVLQTVLQFRLEDLVSFNMGTVETGMNADITEVGNLEKLARYIQLNDAISFRRKAKDYLHDVQIFWRAFSSVEENENGLALEMLKIFIACAEDEKSRTVLLKMLELQTDEQLLAHLTNAKKLVPLFEHVHAYNQNFARIDLDEQESQLLEIQHLSRLCCGDFSETKAEKTKDPEKNSVSYHIGARFYSESLRRLGTVYKKRYFETPVVEAQVGDAAVDASTQNPTSSLKQAIAKCLGVNNYENKSIEEIIEGRFFFSYKKDLVSIVKLFLAGEMDELSLSFQLKKIVEKNKTFSIFRPMSWSSARVKSLEDGLNDFSQKLAKKQEQILKSESQQIAGDQSIVQGDISKQKSSLAFQQQIQEMEDAVAFSVPELVREQTSSSTKILELLKKKSISRKYKELLQEQAQLAGAVAGYIARLKGESVVEDTNSDVGISDISVDSSDFLSAGNSSETSETGDFFDADSSYSGATSSPNASVDFHAKRENSQSSESRSDSTSVEAHAQQQDLITQLEFEFQKTKSQVEITWNEKESYSDLVVKLGLLHDANRKLAQTDALQESLQTAYLRPNAPAAA